MTEPGADYLRRILNSRVYDVAKETPLDLAPELSSRLRNQLLVKREDLQEIFSFKVRGAYNKMANLSTKELAKGVIASSAGNHAQGVAVAANRLGCKAVIVMPQTAPSLKVDAVRRSGAEVVLHGDSYSDAFAHAQDLMAASDLTFVHPFDDPDVIAGQGTIAMEILRQQGQVLDIIFVPVGGGGMISGIAAYTKLVRPEVKVVGVQHNESTAMAQSIAAGRIVEIDDVGLFSDGTAVKRVGDETFRLVAAHVDELITVSTDETCAAIKDAFTDLRALLEPAGALAIAGAKAYVAKHGVVGQTFVAVASGANVNFDRLRFVSERAEIGEEREAVFAVTIPEQLGSFRRFCHVIGERSVSEFNYRMSDDTDAHVFVGVVTSDHEEKRSIAESFEAEGFPTIDLTNDELAKAHIRHLVGGRSQLASDELLYRFEFPERPGALMKFLEAMNPNWNISLFHYRSHGGDTGRVLVGIQVPPSDNASFSKFLADLGYRYWDESANPAFHLFLTHTGNPQTGSSQ